MIRALSTAVCVLALSSVPALADEIRVPADEATIQAAIDRAVDGDQVLVSPGSYVENLRFAGKRLRVASTDGPSVTELRPADPSVSTVQFIDGERRRSRLIGFTIAGGRASRGAGVYCLGSGPTLRGNVFVDNHASEYGGAVYSEDGSLLVQECLFEGNSSSFRGGAISMPQGFIEIEFCEFRGNKNLWTRGGALSLGGSDGRRSRVVGCSFENNLARDFGGACYSTRSLCDWVDNRFVGNTTRLGSGALTIQFPVTDEDGASRVARNRFERNTAADEGGALLVTDARDPLIVEDCLFLENEADAGGGVSLRSAHCVLDRNTFHENVAKWGHDLHVHGRAVQARDCIFSAGPSSTLIRLEQTHLSLAYTNLRGGPGSIDSVGSSLVLRDGVIKADPLFVDAAAGDFRLAAGSPCIDAGRYADASLLRDLAGRSRAIDGDLDRLLRVDMGAHEFQHATLEVGGSTKAGELLELRTQGTAGLGLFLWYGFAAGSAEQTPYGLLEIDLARSQDLLFLGTTPDVTSLTVPPGLQGLSLTLQSLVLSSSNAGALSNAVSVLFE